MKEKMKEKLATTWLCIGGAMIGSGLFMLYGPPIVLILGGVALIIAVMIHC